MAVQNVPSVSTVTMKSLPATSLRIAASTTGSAHAHRALEATTAQNPYVVLWPMARTGHPVSQVRALAIAKRVGRV